MKEKILAALKTKYANLGFGLKALDGMAAVLAKTVTDESQLETAVNGVEEILKVFQADADRARTEYNTLKRQYDELKAGAETPPANGGGQDNKNEPDKTFDAEAFKIDLLKKIRKKQAAATQQSRHAAQRTADIASKATEFGIPPKIVSKLTIVQDMTLTLEVFSNDSSTTGGGFRKRNITSKETPPRQ
ncbi:hypothetical protein [uncultured Alistipes sp.]|uniref:hypothetical protein n=1 Tax=uncultured Alistipes sp. TaxID=538949 RepID=UPI00266F6D37|nr:hypothetical protein [uncultured Alistipes sp.]